VTVMASGDRVGIKVRKQKRRTSEKALWRFCHLLPIREHPIRALFTRSPDLPIVQYIVQRSITSAGLFAGE
jgi:hypothetical protein